MEEYAKKSRVDTRSDFARTGFHITNLKPFLAFITLVSIIKPDIDPFAGGVAFAVAVYQDEPDGTDGGA